MFYAALKAIKSIENIANTKNMFNWSIHIPAFAFFYLYFFGISNIMHENVLT